MRELRMLDRPRKANTTNLNLDGGLLPGSITTPSPEQAMWAKFSRRRTF